MRFLSKSITWSALPIKLRVEYVRAVYNYNLGLAKLDHVAGRDVAIVQPLLPPPPHKRSRERREISARDMPGGCTAVYRHAVSMRRMLDPLRTGTDC